MTRRILGGLIAAAVGAATLAGPATPAAAADCTPTAPGRSTVVLLVHGQDSSPEVWTTGTSPLTEALAASSDVVQVPVDLTSGDGAWVTDDAVGPLLARTIACWSAASLQAHGPGRVVVVAEGTAGWAVQCALDDDCGGVPGVAAAVGEVVTVGMPVDGFALHESAGQVEPDDPAWPVCQALTGSARAMGPMLTAVCSRWAALVAADDADALAGTSDELGDLPAWPADLARYAINATSTEASTLFGAALPDDELGDLVATPPAAGDGSAIVQTVDCGSWTLASTPDGIDLTGGTCWQGDLAAYPDTTSLVVDAVASWATAHRCGLDLTAPEIAAAIDQVPVFDDYPWDPDYLTGNFDRCATLSGVSLGIQGATASSPMQVMLFHRGEYLGTGTSDSYRSSYVDADTSTDDTVVVDYVYARPWDGTTASAGGLASIRYRWDGEAVAMLDTLPEYLADSSTPVTIGLDGFGPFRWGDTRETAEAALISEFVVEYPDISCYQAELEGYGMPVFGVEDGVVAVGAVFDDTGYVVTDTGLRIGDPEQRIDDVYDDVSLTPDPSDAYSARYTVEENGRVGQFIAYDGVIQYMQFGLAGSVGEAPCV